MDVIFGKYFSDYYWVFIEELCHFSMQKLNDSIYLIEKVIQGKKDNDSFGGQAASVIYFDKNVAEIFLYNEKLGTIETLTLYKHLLDYKSQYYLTDPVG